ncbi:MAG: ATP-dependent sacrificial sulfur transferase LarE [Desulfobacterales bacterium]
MIRIISNDWCSFDEKYQKLKVVVQNLGKVLVAFSGGVDSTFLLKITKDLLPAEHVLAVTALSDTMARQEYIDARAYAKALGVEHVLVESKELDIPEFVQNPPDKCYICKKHRFGKLVEIASNRGFDFVADGENIDDKLDFRPGSLAAKELGIRSPLQEAGLTKKDIRFLSRELSLPSWNKPSFACLASRIPYYQTITKQKLVQVDKAEEFLRKLEFIPQLRVRHYGDTARIEMDAKDMDKLAEKGLRKKIVHHFRLLGFKFITMDLDGYRMGSLNREI